MSKKQHKTVFGKQRGQQGPVLQQHQGKWKGTISLIIQRLRGLYEKCVFLKSGEEK